MFETTVSVVGYVITEPRVRETAGGERVASFRVVSTSRRYDRQQERWVDGDRFFATVHCWRNLAEAVLREVRKRQGVVLSGRLRTREYESGGEWRVAVEIEAAAVGIDLAWWAREGPAADATAAPVAAGAREAAPPPARTGEIPPQRVEPDSIGSESTAERVSAAGG
jgi:single-strand DNA-binding protein